MVRFIFALSILFALSTTPLLAAEYPASPDFDVAGSDAQAIAVADEVMEALGGYEAWNKTRYITWRFFGFRLHVWDKWTGNLRFEHEDLTVLMNINSRQGRAWINDAYWLVMPYKLKDSGVTLQYQGKGQTQDDRAADVLSLTFKEVGVTPQNKYEVWVDAETRLVTQWAFYAQASDAEPRFIGPWNHWQKHGQILLSDNRGKRSHTDLAVFADLPAAVFVDPQPIDLIKMAQ